MIWLLGANAAKSFDAFAEVQGTTASVALVPSGIYVMSGSAKEQQQLVIDAGRQGYGWAGHGHADALSVQLAAGGKLLLTDPGTCTYVTAAGERNRFRGTGSHSTVQVDGLSQAEPAGPFKWSGLANAKAERWVTGEAFDLFVGSHAGYNRLANPVLHRRCVFYAKPHFWLVRDIVEGSGLHQVDVSWNFAPGSLFPFPGGVRFLGHDGAILTAMFTASQGFKHEFLQSWYSPRYGSKEPSPLFRVGAEVQLPIECATVLIPGFENQARFDVIQAQPSDHTGVPVHGYRFSADHTTHEVFFSETPGTWTMGRFASDARFVYCATSAAGSQFAICDGTHLEAEGQRLFTSDILVAKREWFSANEPLLPLPAFFEIAYEDGIRDAEEQSVCAGPVQDLRPV